MKVRGLVRAGTLTDRWADTRRFFRDRLGLEITHDEDGWVVFTLPDSARLEVFSAGHGRDHFTSGPVPEFLVDDVGAAAKELRAAGVPVWGPWGGEENARYGWLHFRAPDGKVYGLTNGPEYRRR
jgi:catechol 2,3-dioxygenase-like lactoylglutathione lyase family enzyme